MRASLVRLLANTSELRQYVRFLELEKALLASPVTRGESRFLTRLRNEVRHPVNRRRFSYTTIVVSLYGFWEEYVEQIVRAWVRQTNKLTPSFRSLPPTVADRHLPLSLALLDRIHQRRYTGVVTPEEIVSNLHSCLADATPYALNTEAFAAHQSNIRHETIEDMISRLGVTNACQRMRDAKASASFVAARFPGRRSGTVEVAEYFWWLDDLAERRNEAAHGVPVNILSPDLLLDYVGAVDTYAKALYEILRDEMLPIEVAYGCIELGQPIRVFTNRICGIRLRSGMIAVGDRIIMKTRSNQNPYVEAEVKDLEINRVKHDCITAPPEEDVGIQLDRTVRQAYKLYLVKTDPPAPIHEQLELGPLGQGPQIETSGEVEAPSTALPVTPQA